jgi:protein-S-isoprenylcysteine O-methyltransferase Ste14
MNVNTPNTLSSEKASTMGLVLKRLIQVILVILFQAAILFIAAGRLDWTMAWAYVGVYLAIMAINALVLLRKNPELIAERAQTKENTKGWDKALSILIAIPMLGTLVVAGLDVRFGWSLPLALVIQLAALVCLALGYGLFSWAMASNQFFARVVRIQMDRAQTVASGGPYRYVRHPGYVGMIITMLATPLLLGSLWALAAAGLAACLFVVRTALEDATLQAELEGYRDYARQVRYRLLPGVW